MTTWSAVGLGSSGRTFRSFWEHEALRKVCGGAPSQWALYRFAVKLRANRPLLAACLDRVAASLETHLPGLGRDVAIDTHFDWADDDLKSAMYGEYIRLPAC
jgi:hypothetical protein